MKRFFAIFGIGLIIAVFLQFVSPDIGMTAFIVYAFCLFCIGFPWLLIIFFRSMSSDSRNMSGSSGTGYSEVTTHKNGPWSEPYSRAASSNPANNENRSANRRNEEYAAYQASENTRYANLNRENEERQARHRAEDKAVLDRYNALNGKR